MTETRAFVVSFAGLTAAESDGAADDMEGRLRRLHNIESIARVRESANHQDFGASIAIVLGAPAAVAVAKGIADWLRGRERGEVIIKTQQGTIVARGGVANGIDVVHLAKLFSGEPPEAKP